MAPNEIHDLTVMGVSRMIKLLFSCEKLFNNFEIIPRRYLDDTYISLMRCLDDS
jgi:hypothetical protein